MGIIQSFFAAGSWCGNTIFAGIKKGERIFHHNFESLLRRRQRAKDENDGGREVLDYSPQIGGASPRLPIRIATMTTRG